MKDVKTNIQGIAAHPNIVVSLLSGPSLGAHTILSYFEDEVRKGKVFRAGETVQMGWLMLMLKATDAGELEVWEPRFGAIPIVWERGASRTYRQLIVQKSVAEQLGVEPSFPSLVQSAVVSPNFETSRDLLMSREPSTGTDSGWLFAADSNESEGGRLVSLFEIASKRPEVIPFLALPPSASVVLKDGRVTIKHGDEEVSSDSSELLRRLPASDLIAAT
ncbi:immunity protein Imm33 domain-containing protein [Paraburkholderia azotifigens]|uniref:Imm33-like domain-containing protein n=1 Tax=Paraburkholderia azotifigens TaxID=2057004 RepID=A0A5C6VNY9_9BURK|nr:hypothetical protein [Paraburkholderia azotifigens]TXC87192.1 hypothetical protein FRZ40_06115 [Paraburkholderia azotifigens]